MDDMKLDLGDRILDFLVDLNRARAAHLLKADRPVAVPRPALDESTLYLGDNGRAFCGRLHCAGVTAHWSGRDLSGEPVEPLTPRLAADYGIACEGCGLKPLLVITTRM